MSPSNKTWGVGADTSRPDAWAKATGRAEYLADIPIRGCLHAAVVASDKAPARIRSLGVDKARELPGVHAALVATDLEGSNRIGAIYDDQPLLAERNVHMVGERLALIAAEEPEIAAHAASLVERELEPLDGVYDVEEALSPSAPHVHPGGNLIREYSVERGDLAGAKEKGEVRIANTYRIGGQEHAYLEGQACLAVPGPRSKLTVYSSTQCPGYVRGRVCRTTGLSHADVRVIQTVTGGGFGGKEDYPDEPACCAALLALRTGRPVRLLLERGLDFQASTKRHRMVVENTLWATREGKITGVQVDTLVDAGGYAGLSTVVAERANISCVGPYTVEAARASTKVVYTNNLFGGPFRGFGAPQVTAAMEAQMDRLAKEVGLDPVEIRRRNMVCAETPYFVSGQEISDADLAAETLDAAVDSSGWEGRYREQEPVSATIGPREASSRYRTGIGIGAMVYGANLHHGGQRFDRGGAHVLVQPDGTINVSIGNTEMGQGALAASRAIASEALGVEQSRIRISEVDTAVVPDSGPTVASRGTQVSGRAIIDACAVVRKRIKEVGASMLGSVPAVQVEIEGDLVRDPVSGREVDFEEVIAEYYERRINPLAVGWFRSEDRRYDPGSGTGSPYAYYCFATHIARVRVDTWTGHVKVLEVTAAHDVGKAVHPPSLEGQIQGGVTQAVGWSTLEELVLHRGMLRNRGFTDYLIPTTTDAPKVVIRLIEKPEEHGPFGAKGIGEPSFIPCGAAVLNAVSNALGIELCEMPLTAERVRASIAGEGTGDGKPGQPYLSHLSPPDRDR